MSIKNEIAAMLREEASTADPDLEATFNQINFLAFLLLQRHKVYTDEKLKTLRAERSANKSLTKARAGDEITTLKEELGMD